MKIVYILAFLCLNISAFAQEHQLVSIPLNDGLIYSTIRGLDIVNIKKDVSADVIVTEANIKYLQENNIDYKVIISNLESYLAKRYSKSLTGLKTNPKLLGSKHFKLGSFGGFHPLDSVYEIFKQMGREYPNYLRKTAILEYTFEERPIYSYCFGDCSGKEVPEVLLTALHHAREPGGTSALMYYMWELCERAESGDTLAKYILANRSIYVIPAVNPDGFYYNQTTNPQGGGLWRKNRRKLNDSTFGVDLNRNYGPYEYWNAPNFGSSEKPNEITYRGASPFSENETQAIRDFCQSRKFRTALNYHSYSNLLIYPYSALSAETPDSLFYRSLAEFCSKDNLYYHGTDFYTVGYSTRGSSDDYMYLAIPEKAKIFVMTPEIGNMNDFFWPPAERILGHCADNVPIIETMILSASSHVRPFEVFSGSETLKDGNQQSYVSIKLKNIGTDASSSGVKVNVKSGNADLSFFDYIFEIPGLDLNQDTTVRVYAGVKPEFKNGDKVPVIIEINNQGMVTLDTFKMSFASYSEKSLFTNETLSGSWNMGLWGKVYDDILKRFVLNDSPNGLYADSSNNYLTMDYEIDLADFPSSLEFLARWKTEPHYDAGLIEISSDKGANWEKLSSSLMVSGYNLKDSRLKQGTGFMGYFPSWVRQSCDLQNFKGKSIKIRFGLLCDRGKNYDGFFVDDIKIRTFDYPKYSAVKNEIQLKRFEIYPNPLPKNGRLMINMNSYPNNLNEKDFHLNFYNIESSLVKTLSLSLDDINSGITAEFLLPGAYILEIKGADYSEKFKLIVIE